MREGRLLWGLLEAEEVFAMSVGKGDHVLRHCWLMGGWGRARWQRLRAAAVCWLLTKPGTGTGVSHTFSFSPPNNLVGSVWLSSSYRRGNGGTGDEVTCPRLLSQGEVESELKGGFIWLKTRLPATLAFSIFSLNGSKLLCPPKASKQNPKNAHGKNYSERSFG